MSTEQLLIVSLMLTDAAVFLTIACVAMEHRRADRVERQQLELIVKCMKAVERIKIFNA